MFKNSVPTIRNSALRIRDSAPRFSVTKCYYKVLVFGLGSDSASSPLLPAIV